MSKYEDVLILIDSEFSSLENEKKKFQESASTYIPRLFEALKEEAGKKFDAKKAADRIKADCSHFWSVDWIRRNLPEEAKDETKSEAAKASHASRKSKKEEEKPIEILTDGNPADSEKPSDAEVLKTVEAINAADAAMNPEGLLDNVAGLKEVTELPSLSSPEMKEISELKAVVENLKNERKEAQGEIERLAKAISAISANAKASPVYKQLEDQFSAAVKEIEELKTALQQSQQLTSAGEQELKAIKVTLKNSKLQEAFIVIRNALDKKRDVEIVADTSKAVVMLRGINPT
jgi:hypothetical protein